MICVKELVKNFDDVCAVNNITLNIPEGEMLGLLGTNGAGKTTLLRMIAGVLEADGGSIVVDGANITSGDVSEEIFYLPDDPYFFPNASMEEMILFYKKYYPRMDVEKIYKETTGKDMVRFYRPPQGKYSKENLKMAQDLGYKTFFWSLAYVDWYDTDQPTKAEAFDKLLKRIHPGAIVLLHSTSKTNTDILDELLTKWKEMGYQIKPLTQLP